MTPPVKTDPATGIRYHQITHAELKAGDEILPWDLAAVGTTGTFRMMADARPLPDTDGMVEVVTDRAGIDQRPGKTGIRIRERAEVARKAATPPPGSPTQD